ncbi:Gfo/Idh/MocA family oxidoreductase [Paeniglutamicibacter antarcticus]|uniref:Gfo/Idh/MocA family oxidoreductase n=1 Tax=Arthrobacter terrae TaxID=2935737 RepID=A0A931G5N2_9MICC|nr:Gfo/Idh/MocA family oxidoreductase [Arthrobacter terrae]MBG0739750.1 Gfo/Idh/MocA family oxidoreductase [Arthrobacter terrae]
MSTSPRYIARPDWYASGSPHTLNATGEPLRWGVVATGNIAHTVTSELALLEDAVLQAVSSRSRGKAADFAAHFGFKRHYYDGGTMDSDASGRRVGVNGDDGRASPGYLQLVQDPEVDVVYVATPHAQHYAVARAALEAGKHVLCEKALTINVREAAELIDLARERGLFLMEAVWARFVPGMQRAFEIAASGEMGDVQWVQADLGFPAGTDRTARIWAPEAGGGALLDLTVYPLLWAWGTLGAPASVTASGTLTPWGVDSQNAITLAYPSGALAQLTSSLTAYGPRTAVVAGSKGFLRSTGSINNPTALEIQIGSEPARVESFDFPGRGYTYQLREVTRCIQQGLTESPTMPLADSLAIMALFDGVRGQLGITYPADATSAG